MLGGGDFLCCDFAGGYKLSGLEAEHLHVKITFLPLFIYLYGQTIFFFFNHDEFNAESSSFSCHRTLFNIEIISQFFGVGGLAMSIVVSLHGV